MIPYRVAFLFIAFCLGLQSGLADPCPIDVSTLPFSHYGSYMALLSRLDENGKTRLYVTDISGNRLWADNRVMAIELTRGSSSLDYSINADSSRLLLKCEAGSAEIAFESADILRFRTHGPGLRLKMISNDPNSMVIPVNPSYWRIQMGSNAHYVFGLIQGKAAVSGPSSVVNPEAEFHQRKVDMLVDATPDGNGALEASIEQNAGAWTPVRDVPGFDACVRASRADLDAWAALMPSVPPKYATLAKVAAYQTWSAVVQPRGLFHHAIMLSSKNALRGVWSWDHCFHAWLAAESQPDFAWDQMNCVFEYQDPKGFLPDAITDRMAIWGYVKPPIHGWVLRKMIAANPMIGTAERLAAFYPELERWTNYWMRYNNDSRDGIPQYNHGNDSGMDNSTAFDMGFPAQSPNLCAYLVLQMEMLSEIDRKLGRKEASVRWERESEALLARMIKELWDGEKFVARQENNHRTNPQSQSVMRYLPLVLGKRLPPAIRQKMIADLKSEQGPLTRIGLATENPHGPLYRSDGYWRGPVWAPTTLIVLDGLRECGEEALAVDLARRYCDACLASGFSENFDALTGQPLRDKTVTWTTATFIILAHEYL
ncbi:MAG: trehalase family glycosidase [Opitutaceae bacterium]